MPSGLWSSYRPAGQDKAALGCRGCSRRDGARLIQFVIGGVDFIPLGELPEGVPVATNGGGYAESMAEHALAMALAAAKRLVLEHENLKRGQFNQFTRNRMLAGRVCGIFGFGGIGAATGRLMHGIGMR